MAVTAANVRALEGSRNRRKVAGGTVNMGDAVYIDSNSKVQQALATTAAASEAVGVVSAVNDIGGATQATSGIGVDVTVFGPVGGFSSLTPGVVYYVDASTAGAITATAPTGGSKWAKSVGYAESDTILFVLPGVRPAISSAGA